MDRGLIREYISAFKAANPAGPEVEVSYSGGWYQIKANNLYRPLRKPDLERARDRLKQRAERNTR